MPSNFQAIKGHLQKGQMHAALDLLQKIDSVNFDTTAQAELHYWRAITYRYLGELENALAEIDFALKLDDKKGLHWQEKGQLLQKMNEPEAAIGCFQQAVAFNWALKASWKALAELYSLSGDNPNRLWCACHIELLSQLPSATQHQLYQIFDGNAEQLCIEFIEQLNQGQLSWRELWVAAVAMFFTQRYQLAERVLVSLRQQGVQHDLVDYLLANVLAQKQDFFSSLILVQNLYSRYSSVIEVKFLLANQLAATDAFDEAKMRYQELVKSAPSFEQAWLNLGHLAKTIGDTDLAINSYQRVIAIRPTNGDAYWSLANLKHYDFAPELLEQMKSLASSNISNADKTPLLFALGYGFEKQGGYEQSFEYYQQGNALKAETISYTPAMLNEEFDKMCLAPWPRKDNGENALSLDNTPIFILGMPRAGSTLLEQILATHSKVSATFELPYILSFAKRLNQEVTGKGHRYYSEDLSILTPELGRILRASYLENVDKLNLDTPYFIDKMPNNFRHIGLIKWLFPEAKIVDIRREKMACCFSNFKQLYGQGQEFSYNFEAVLHYYQKYTELMNYWHQAFPNQIHFLRYEDLVDDTEITLEKLLSYLQLDIEPSCLAHHENVGKVRTASAEQVRRPIYNKGNTQWQNFEPFFPNSTFSS